MRYDENKNLNILTVYTNGFLGIGATSNCIWRFKYQALKITKKTESAMGSGTILSTVYQVVLVVEEPALGWSTSSIVKNASLVEKGDNSKQLCYQREGSPKSCFWVENTDYRKLSVVMDNPTIDLKWAMISQFGKAYTPEKLQVLVGDRLISNPSVISNSSAPSSSNYACSALNPELCNKEFMKSASKDKVTFRDWYFENIDADNKDTKSIVTYQCNECVDGTRVNSTNSKCARSDNEEVYLMGFPIFNFQFIIVLMIIALLLWIISKRK
jgi:hypothetical protein